MTGCQWKVSCLRSLGFVMANTEVEDNIYRFCKIVHPSGNLEEDKLIQSMIQ